ncbi:MAG: globin [Aquihabitans sp.]
MSVSAPGDSLFHRVGGRPYFDGLVTRFYARVETDEVLLPMYPEDLTDSIRNTAGFIAQFFGGGTAEYSDERGHPRLRGRHMGFVIGQVERDAWARHMLASVAESDASAADKAQLIEYFEMAATHMINT